MMEKTLVNGLTQGFDGRLDKLPFLAKVPDVISERENA
jgi:hypothetical protein